MTAVLGRAAAPRLGVHLGEEIIGKGRRALVDELDLESWFEILDRGAA